MRVLLLSCIMQVLTILSFAQGNFYDINTIQKIEVKFSFNNWDYRLDTAKAGAQGYTMAQWVKINGQRFDSVGVKYKGGSSYRNTRNKNPLHIELDNINPNHHYQGYTDVKLGNGYTDPSFIREALGYDILSQYMHGSKSNFAQVWINDTLKGLYSNTESVNKTFCGRHFYSSNNPFFKVNIVGSLNYLGRDSTPYIKTYEEKSNYGYKELISLCETLATNAVNINKLLDIDRALWMHAYNNVMVNLDSYTGKFAHNYYLYMDDNQRFNTIVWDLNMCFASFRGLNLGPNISLIQAQNLSPFAMDSVSKPLINKLLATPIYRRMYLAHLRTIVNENFANNSYQTKAVNLQAIIDTAVQSDPNKFYSYNLFKNSLIKDTANTPGIYNLMTPRTTYLLNHTEFQKVSPKITNVMPNPTNPFLNDSVTITATVTNALATAVYLGYRYYTPNKFTGIKMFDDGNHNDGAANDNVFGVKILLNSGSVEYYLYAENTQAGIFSPERAEYQFYTLNATIQSVNKGDLVINECIALNATTLQDSTGDFGDWIEIYNTTAYPINLTAICLSDDFANPKKWTFPANTIIAANSYLIIWADQKNSGLHTNFKLSGGGDEIILSYSSGIVLDSVRFGLQTTDVTYGRYPNGNGPFATMPPTPNAQNAIFTPTEPAFYSSKFNFYPNPSNGNFSIQSENTPIQKIEIYNLHSQPVFTQNYNKINHIDLQLDNIPNGIYNLQVNNISYKLIINH